MTDLIRREDALTILLRGKRASTDIIEAIAALPAVTVGVKPWGYCPECGCEEPRFGEGPHKQCARCYQEWFTDIDYSEVVRCNLQKLFIAAFAVTPKVKPLVWKETYEKVPKSAWASHTGFGRWFIVLEFLGMNHAVYRLHEIDYPTLDAAKAAAQRDYEARILAALEPVAAPDPAAIREASPNRAYRVGYVAGRAAALREAEKALRDWQASLNVHRMPETAVTVGIAADVVADLIAKGAAE